MFIQHIIFIAYRYQHITFISTILKIITISVIFVKMKMNLGMLAIGGGGGGSIKIPFLRKFVMMRTL